MVLSDTGRYMVMTVDNGECREYEDRIKALKFFEKSLKVYGHVVFSVHVGGSFRDTMVWKNGNLERK